MEIINKEQFILNIFSIFPDYSLSPVQFQKLFFLLEKRIGDEAKVFNFEPYIYGPYDKELTQLITKLTEQGKLNLSIQNGVKQYQVNKQYIQSIDKFLDDKKIIFIKKLVEFVRNKTFKDLCFAIYNEFDDMKKNSILI